MQLIYDIIDVFSTIGTYIFPMNLLLGIIIVFFERRNVSSLWAWLLLMYFMPVSGFILYLFLGQDLRRKKLFRIKEVEDTLQKAVHVQEETIFKHKLTFPDERLNTYVDTVRFHLNSSKSIYSNNNNVDIFCDGYEKFNALKEDLINAKRYIHMQYYIIRNDFLSNEIMDILCDKAKEGVEVRLLYDGMGCLQVKDKFFSRLTKNGGQVGEFFPPFIPIINIRLNFRNHRKICIIDGEKGYVGGFNIGKEYLGLGKLGHWRDTHIKIKGSAVDSLQLRFALDWDFATKENISANLKYYAKHKPEGNTGIQIVSSGPDSKWQNVRNGYLKLMNEAEKNIYIQTPYFIPDDSVLEALRIAALAGLDVRIMIPCKPDHMFVYWASLSYAGELLKAGAKCYTYDDGFIHSKTISVDGIASSVGTANMDIRSFKLNFEVNAFIYDPSTTQKLEDNFMKDMEKCTELTLESYYKRSLLVKFKESISRLLSPIL